MGLTTWKGSIVRKGDIIIAKNYLSKNEIDSLNRLVNIFLESAEMRVKERKDLTLEYWKKNVDDLIQFQGLSVLKDKGKVTSKEMEHTVNKRYAIFDKRRKDEAAKLADENDLKMLEDIEREIIKKSKIAQDDTREENKEKL